MNVGIRSVNNTITARKYWFLVFILLGTACHLPRTAQRKIRTKGIYATLWGETIWAYQLYPDNTYLYQTSGHFGFTETIGSYRIVADSIYLTAFPAEKQKDRKSHFIADTLLIISKDTLVDRSTRYEHLWRKDLGGSIYAGKKRPD